MGASTISISIEETNRIRGFFGLKLIPVPDASKRVVIKKKSLKNGLHKQDKNAEPPTYKSSEFIDIGLLNKKQYTKTNKSITTSNLLSVSSDEDEEDEGVKGDWLSKIKSGENQNENETATSKDNKNNQTTKKRTSSPSELKDKLVQSIIMTLKEQEIMDDDGFDDDGSNHQGKKDILTKEEEFDSKDIARVEKSFKSKKKRNFEESESTEQRTVKKLQKVTFKGKMRVSFSDSDNDSEDADDPNTPSGDYAPVKIKKRKVKNSNNSTNTDKMRVKNFQMKKVELHDTDDDGEDDELAELNQALTRERLKHNVSKPKRTFIKKVVTTKPISATNTVVAQTNMSTDFLNSLSVPKKNDLTSVNKNTHADNTESSHLGTALGLIPNETSQPSDPNFYDGLASTLNYLKTTNDAVPDRKISNFTENHSLKLTGNETSSEEENNNNNNNKLDPKPASPILSLKYLDETTGEELDPKKAFQQFNKNFYKNKKRKTKTLDR